LGAEARYVPDAQPEPKFVDPTRLQPAGLKRDEQLLFARAYHKGISPIHGSLPSTLLGTLLSGRLPCFIAV